MYLEFLIVVHFRHSSFLKLGGSDGGLGVSETRCHACPPCIDMGDNGHLASVQSVLVAGRRRDADCRLACRGAD